MSVCVYKNAYMYSKKILSTNVIYVYKLSPLQISLNPPPPDKKNPKKFLFKMNKLILYCLWIPFVFCFVYQKKVKNYSKLA